MSRFIKTAAILCVVCLAAGAAFGENVCSPDVPATVPSSGTSGYTDFGFPPLSTDPAATLDGDMNFTVIMIHSYPGDIRFQAFIDCDGLPLQTGVFPITYTPPDTYEGAATGVGAFLCPCDDRTVNTLRVHDIYGGDTGVATSVCLDATCIIPPPTVEELLAAIEEKLDTFDCGAGGGS